MRLDRCAGGCETGEPGECPFSHRCGQAEFYLRHLATVQFSRKKDRERGRLPLFSTLPTGEIMREHHALTRTPGLAPIALLLLLALAATAQGGTTAAPALPSANNARRTPLVDLVERVRGAVVNIHSERTVQGPASEDLFAMTTSQHRVNGMGTGIIIDPRGYIITNQHVVEDVNVIRVRLADGSNYNARVVAR